MLMIQKTLITLALLCSGANAYEEVVILPRERGVKINRFFYDFKSPGAPKKFMRDGWAEMLLKEYGFTGVRTSIYGTGNRPAHPEPGVVVEKYYEAETKGLKRAKKINPDVLIFASKKLDNTESFPEWTKNARGVVPDQYAILLVDYLAYMKREGLKVDVLGLDNERRFNEGNIMPATHRDIVLALRRLTKERGIAMPKIIGPEDYAMGRNDWMKTFEKMDSDTMDIFGGHYYTRHRPLEKLKSDLEYAGKREKWHSELHWDAHGDSKGSTHSFETAICSFLALWDCVDCGMNGFMWWDLNPKKKRRDHLMHAASVPLINAFPIKVIDPDGADTVDEMKLHTRAFLKGDTLTVYALNLDPSKKWKELRFKLSTGRIVGKIDGRKWTDDFPDEGKSGTIKPFTSRSFRVDITPRSMNMFQFQIKP